MVKVTTIPTKPAPTVVKVELELNETQAAILKSIMGSIGGNMLDVQQLAGPLYRELDRLSFPNADPFKLHDGNNGYAGSRYYDKA